MSTDELQWITALRHGDTIRFSELYHHFSPKIYQLCFRFTGHAGEAEEHTQDIFLKLFQKRHSFKGESSFFTWFYRLAVNHMNNVVRRKRPAEVEQVLDAPASGGLDQAHHIALEQAIQSLSPGFRSVFVLHDRQGHSHEEIADMLGIAVGTSKSQLCRARLALREQLKPYLEASHEP
ncbi:MAG: sigma-70 family RNA polymerase sigma factor [Acidobacteria bacterium]|nr:sigma-70 family RNA polymerase sigma factor [Acidobacteriota bacterium]